MIQVTARNREKILRRELLVDRDFTRRRKPKPYRHVSIRSLRFLSGAKAITCGVTLHLIDCIAVLLGSAISR